MTSTVRQTIYDQKIVDAVAEMFGITSVEYGMALCGSLALPKHIGKQYSSRYGPEDIVKVSAGEGDRLIKNAEFTIKAQELRKKIEEHIGHRPTEQMWFKDDTKV